MDIHTPIHHTPNTKPVSLGGFSVKTLFLIVLILIGIGGATVALITNRHYQFASVTVSGTQTFPAHDVEQFTRDYLSGNYISIIPRSSTLLFSKERFERKLHAHFPIIEIAYITFPDPHTLSITIKERTPAVVWCFDAITCGFVDASGILYGRAPVFSDGVYSVFRFERPVSFTETVGTRIIDPVVMNRFIQLFQDLQSDDIVVSDLTFLENNDIAFSIEKLFNRYPPNNAVLLGTMQQDDTLFLRDVQTGLHHEIFIKQYNQSPKSLEYIDLRFPGKVFYKFTTGATPVILE